MGNKHFTDELVDAIRNDKSLDESAKNKVLLNLVRLN